ncbi:cysteine desulfurase [Candidatus Parcubacteria bacterium]|nr:MAG: cysteine desulfurase [Candidatus Parcubacteria bacterium]
MRVYLDHSATTPTDKKVLAAMEPYFSEIYGNPSSLHTFGQEAAQAVDKAREQIAAFLNCQIGELVFTSGATESDNLAIRGLIAALKAQGVDKPHIITTKIEHEAVLEPCAQLEKEGIEVTYLPVDKSGVVNTAKLKDSIKDNTVLVSVMYVNSEVGSIQPIRKIGKIITKANEKRLREWHNTRPSKRGTRPVPIYFHTDATQALNFLNCDTQDLLVDLLSFSGHKIYGPKGVGGLFVKQGTPLKPLQLGGHQEKNLRSGTLNVTGIVGLGAACAQLTPTKVAQTNQKIKKLRDILVEGILTSIPKVRLNTDREVSTPAHAHFTFFGVEGESILISLDFEGIAVSTGSACASRSLKPSHVVLALGIPKEDAHSSIRFTLGKYTTLKEIRYVLKVLPPIIQRLRQMAPRHSGF